MRTQIWTLFLAAALCGCGGDDAGPPAARDASVDAAAAHETDAALLDAALPGHDAQALDAQLADDASYDLPDACAATDCPKGWKCVLQQVECVRAPCYPVADCQAPD